MNGIELFVLFQALDYGTQEFDRFYPFVLPILATQDFA